MRTFSELYSDLSEKKFRAVSKAERRKKAIRMARLAKTSSFKLKVAKSKLKVLPPEKLKIKAHKVAKQKIVNKYFPNYDKYLWIDCDAWVNSWECIENYFYSTFDFVCILSTRR